MLIGGLPYTLHLSSHASAMKIDYVIIMFIYVFPHVQGQPLWSMLTSTFAVWGQFPRSTW